MDEKQKKLKRVVSQQVTSVLSTASHVSKASKKKKMISHVSFSQIKKAS